MNGPLYLDHNASTPADDRVIAVVASSMKRFPANPSSVEHLAGTAAAAVVDEARSEIAMFVGCRPREIVFTSGSTESNNLAILGLAARLTAAGRTKIITSAIEHPSVLAPAAYLETLGFDVTIVPVGPDGQVDVSKLEAALDEITGLVSIMAANNETGVIQPLEEIGRLCARVGSLFHSDFSQAGAYLPISPRVNGLHLASLSGHKMYGPKGVGVLYRRLRSPRVQLYPILHGGGHELGVRSGTLNLPGILGMAKSCVLAGQLRDEDSIRLRKLKVQLTQELKSTVGAVVNGDEEHSLPNTVSLSIEDIEPFALIHALRDKVSFSASSACSTEKIETSHVLLSMYGPGRRAARAFRLGLGRSTSASDIPMVAKEFKKAVTRLRSGEIAINWRTE